MKTKLFLLICIFLSSCASVVEIGDVTEISTRNMDSKTEYTVLKTYAGYDASELRKLKGKNIQEAINNTVQSVPGGEFLRNVKIYKVGNDFYSVQGDVWGIAGQVASYYGFKSGDKVTWKHYNKWYTGIIISLKDNKTCLVKVDNDGDTAELKYEELSKIQN